jgi:hypothetical protein
MGAVSGCVESFQKPVVRVAGRCCVAFANGRCALRRRIHPEGVVRGLVLLLCRLYWSATCPVVFESIQWPRRVSQLNFSDEHSALLCQINPEAMVGGVAGSYNSKSI